MTDLTSRITAALDEQQRLAEAARGDKWTVDRSEWSADRWSLQAVLGLDLADPLGSLILDPEPALFIAANDPSSVLRRVAAQRRVLERHQPEEYGEATEFEGVVLPALVACGRCQDNFNQYPEYPCDEIKDLADAVGVDVTGVES